MFIDAQLSFVPIGAPLSLVGGAGVNIPSSNIVDLLGQGTGTPPANIIGTVTTFGEDPGIGDSRPVIEVAIGTAMASGNSATLNVALQGAPDQGVAGGYQPGTWQTYAETGAMTVAQLTANQKIKLDLAAVFPEGTNLPRFLRLLFQVASATNFTVGTAAYAIVTFVRDDLTNKFAAKNYAVA